MRLSSLAAFLLSTGAMASPVPEEGHGVLQKRAQEINHDAVRALPSTVAPGVEGAALKRFQPTLLSVKGCWAYPAVDKDGNWNGGLKPTGGQTAGCTNSVGQTYARGAWHRDRYAMMYCWYFPKDQSSLQLPKVRGHRHDWECAVVWINNPEFPRLQGVSTTAHGGWKRWDVVNAWNVKGDAFKVKYFQDVAVAGTHSLDITGDEGGVISPLVQYETLPAAARDSLNSVNWGSANFIMKDPSFRANLEAAYPFAKYGPCPQC